MISCVANRATNLAAWLARTWGIRMIPTEHAMRSVSAGVSPGSGAGIGRERRNAFPHVYHRARGVNMHCRSPALLERSGDADVGAVRGLWRGAASGPALSRPSH